MVRNKHQKQAGFQTQPESEGEKEQIGQKEIERDTKNIVLFSSFHTAPMVCCSHQNTAQTEQMDAQSHIPVLLPVEKSARAAEENIARPLTFHVSKAN